MAKLLSNKRLAIALFILLDIVTIGMGMGVPFFTILLGLPLGWFLPPYLDLPAEISRTSLSKLLKAALAASLVSLAVLGAIWLPTLSWLFDPSRDIAQFGMPLILFEPLASFIGWIILMVVISPGMQFLMMVFGSMVYYVRGKP